MVKRQMSGLCFNEYKVFVKVYIVYVVKVSKTAIQPSDR